MNRNAGMNFLYLNPEDDGFWADAKEVVDELQSGPARIDGVFMFDQIEVRSST